VQNRAYAKVRILIMMDGFDEISPLYSCGSRPDHISKKKWKISYKSCHTLAPSSEEKQVEYLTKFRGLKGRFSEQYNKRRKISI
jgi:hypothetical protein